jgi:hypothetical protein
MATDFVSIRTRNRNPILDKGTVQGEWSRSLTTFWPNISQRGDAMIHSPPIQVSSMADRLQNRHDQQNLGDPSTECRILCNFFSLHKHHS